MNIATSDDGNMAKNPPHRASLTLDDLEIMARRPQSSPSKNPMGKLDSSRQHDLSPRSSKLQEQSRKSLMLQLRDFQAFGKSRSSRPTQPRTGSSSSAVSSTGNSSSSTTISQQCDLYDWHGFGNSSSQTIQTSNVTDNLNEHVEEVSDALGWAADFQDRFQVMDYLQAVQEGEEDDENSSKGTRSSHSSSRRRKKKKKNRSKDSSRRHSKDKGQDCLSQSSGGSSTQTSEIDRPYVTTEVVYPKQRKSDPRSALAGCILGAKSA